MKQNFKHIYNENDLIYLMNSGATPEQLKKAYDQIPTNVKRRALATSNLNNYLEKTDNPTTAVIRQYLNQGAPVDLSKIKSLSQWHSFALPFKKDVLRLLIKNDISAYKSIYACKFKFNNIFKNCIENGADINLKDNFLMTALDWAIELGNTSIFNFITQQKNLDINFTSHEMGYIPTLSRATDTLNDKLMTSLLAHTNTNPNVQDNTGNTPLLRLLILSDDNYQTLKCTKTLLEHPKINPNIQNKYGETALFTCLGKKYTKLILEHKDTNVNIQDNNGDTALMRAIFNENTETALLIINHPKTDLNIQNHLGMTALMLSVKENNETLFKHLINNPKTDINIKNHIGQTVFNIIQSDKGYSNFLHFIPKEATPKIPNKKTQSPQKITNKKLHKLLFDKTNQKS